MKTNSLSRLFTWQAIAAFCLLSQTAIFSAKAADTNENRGQLSASDYRFASSAARGGMMEVNLGKLAAQKSTDPAVQQFGQRMVTDHTKAGDELKNIASQKGATLPADLTTMQQKHVDRLSNMTGADFDKAYINLMIRDHKMTLVEFQHEAKHGDDADLKTFAANTAPTVQEHLTMVENMKKGEKSSSSASNQ